MRKIWTVVIASAALVITGAGLAAQAPSGGATHTPQTPIQRATPGTPSQVASSTQSENNADESFAKEAAIGGMAEVELGQLAADKGASQGVKSFGQQMVTDHGKANDELKSIASRKSITLPTTLDAKHQSTKDRLSKLSGAAFDRAYIREMVRDHQDDSMAFRRESEQGKDPDIKAFATKTLTIVEHHLQMAKELQQTAAGATKTSSRNSTGTATSTGR